MKFMMMAKASPKNEGQPPTPAMMEAVGKLIEKYLKAGKMVGMGGLLPTRFGAQAQLKNGKVTITDGSFTEATEVIGGYAIMEAASLAEAKELAREFLQVHVDVMGKDYEMTSEIRQMAEE
jgi:hypothetical protein